MFNELNAISLLWPEDASSAMIDHHSKWRAHYKEYWFNKWHQKPRHKSTIEKA